MLRDSPRQPNWLRILAVTVVCGLGLAIWLRADWEKNHEAATVSYIGELPTPVAYYLKLVLIAGLLLSPPVIMILYRRTTILDRYLLRNFLTPFLFCIVAFVSIWLIFDLNDNLPDFRERQTSLVRVLGFYAIQLPLVFTQIAQPVLLIAIVFALGKMSRSNELVSILGAGQSLGRTLLPLFTCGLYVTFVYTVFNYQWAPWAEGHKESLLEQFQHGEEQSIIAERHLFVNGRDRRTWYIGHIPFRLAEENLRIIDIFERDENRRVRRHIQADSASWRWRDASWVFTGCTIARLRANGDLEGPPETHRHIVFEDWEETPWLLVSNRFEPAYLGVPKLLAYLKSHTRDTATRLAPYRTAFHHRWAAPWSCLIVVFVAAPMGIVFSRRGVLGGVATAVFLFAAILFLTELFLSLGKSGYLRPEVAAWLTNIIFLGIGSCLLYARARNRTLRFPRLRRKA